MSPLVHFTKLDTFSGVESPIAISVDHIISVSIDGGGNVTIATPLGGVVVVGTYNDAVEAIDAAFESAIP